MTLNVTISQYQGRIMSVIVVSYRVSHIQWLHFNISMTHGTVPKA